MTRRHRDRSAVDPRRRHAPVALTPETDKTGLRPRLDALLVGRRRGRGGFVVFAAPGVAASGPRSLADALGRVRIGAWASTTLRRPAEAFDLSRLAVALRQEVGRTLQEARGAAPLGVAESAGESVKITAILCLFDGASEAAGATAALERLVAAAEHARWAAWALRRR